LVDGPAEALARIVPTILALQSSAMWRVVHDGQTPLVGQENASK
jgi:hypothetical protein